MPDYKGDYPFDYPPTEAITAKNSENMTTTVSLKVATELLIDVSASMPSADMFCSHRSRTKHDTN
jgi:hypothetical protein